MLLKEIVGFPADYLDEERHQLPVEIIGEEVLVTWRLKERMKTVSVALVLCLNIGTDPPDVVKASPCACLQTWFDPRSTSKSKAIDTIGNNLQQQYERWQARAKYKQALDPTMDDVKKLCGSLRRNAKGDRMLFHYNGHGVPRPTAAGEIWVFNKTYTQYIPLSIYDLRCWVQTPAIYVLDCSGAGVLLSHFTHNQLMSARQGINTGLTQQGYDSATDPVRPTSTSPAPPAATQRDCIVLAPCSASQHLPSNPYFPADIFTACLTTPILVALRWFITQNRLSMGDLDPAFVDQIPGKLTDRKTPLGELNWIFTAITDTIAWNTLPSPVFQRLFRQDLLVASLFRNFLLADRVLRSFNCTPMSIPRLPSTAQHSLWLAWDLAAECCLSQLISDRNPGVSGAETRLAAIPFFADQLTAFEVWLQFHSSQHPSVPPEQLPVVLQVLLSQAHRLRALLLLRRFLDLGSWAVNLALSVGIFPYVLKLLQSPAPELRQVLVCIWARILAFDPSCRTDLVKDNAFLYFIVHLSSTDVHSDQRVMAAFILTVIMDDSRAGQRNCLKKGLLKTCAQFLSQSGTEAFPLFQRWLCFCVAKLTYEHPEGRAFCLREDIHLALISLITSPHVDVRAAAVYTLGALFGFLEPLRDNSVGASQHSPPIEPALPTSTSSTSVTSLSNMSLDGGPVSPSSSRSHLGSSTSLSGHEQQEMGRKVDVSVIALQILRALEDASPLVRKEAVLALFRLVSDSLHLPYFIYVAHEMTRRKAQREGPVHQGGFRKSAADSETEGLTPSTMSEMSNGSAGVEHSEELNAQPLPPPQDAPPEEQESGATHGPIGRGGQVRLKQNGLNDQSPAEAAIGASEGCRLLASRLRQRGGEILEHYLCIWLGIRQVQQKEPFPAVAKMATHIVVLVHERALDTHLDASEMAPFPADLLPPSPTSRPFSPSSPPLSHVGGGGHRQSAGSLRPMSVAGSSGLRASGGGHRSSTAAGIDPLRPPLVPSASHSGPHSTVPSFFLDSSLLAQGNVSTRLSAISQPTVTNVQKPSLPARAVSEQDLVQQLPPAITQPSLVRHHSLARVEEAGPAARPLPPIEESLSYRWLRDQYQDANMYVWSKRQFRAPTAVRRSDDPLSIEGELNIYRRKRDERVIEGAEKLASRCVEVIGVPGDEEVELMEGLDALLSVKPPTQVVHQRRYQALKLHQRAIFDSDAKMTSQLTFHPFEPLLVSVDESATIRVWEYEEHKRSGLFRNTEGQRPARVTSMGWLNETENSLLLTGSDDGVVKVWRGLMEPSWVQPSLVTSFFAHALPGGSPGLVSRIVPASGLLITGGSTDRIRAWDLRREQIVRDWQTGGQACVTTFCANTLRPQKDAASACTPTFARGKNHLLGSSQLIVAGFGDGKVRIFDMRQDRPVSTLHEHQQWIVLTDFVKGEGELLTGSLAGDMRFWDLRKMTHSLRAVDVGKGPMPAMTAHPICPMMAAGSYNQFIKVLTMDGETVNVIRYHDGILGQRVGPIVTLDFHPCRLLLAAGAADSMITVYEGLRTR